jgi:hypothetical protein
MLIPFDGVSDGDGDGDGDGADCNQLIPEKN